MKKILSIGILFVIMALSTNTIVNAVTSAELPNELYNRGAKYGVTTSEKIKMERYLSDYPVTDEEANAILSKAGEAANLMDSFGKTKIGDLTKSEFNQLKTIANEVAEILDVTLVFKNNSVEIYKNGKLIEVIKNKNGKLVYTGNKTNIILVVSLATVLALVAGIIARKKFVNE